MSSIYEALKRTQGDRPVASGAHAPQGVQARKIFWILAAAILISSAATTALLYGVGVVGKAGTAPPPQVIKPPQANPERIIDLMNKAERLHTKGEMLKAIDVYTQIISLSPGLAEAYLKLGSIYYESKLYDKAFETYSSARKLKPNDARLLNNIGSVLLAKGDPAKALNYFIQARRNSMDYVEPIYNMACAYARLKKKEAALSSLRQACNMQPEARLWAGRDPDLASLKEDKDFKGIIRAQ
jgi:tetratricopeptide (TPR) repeat protein